MGLFGYLVLGAVMYLAGFLVNQKLLKKYRTNEVPLPIKHPVIIKCIVGCFVVMLAVSVLIGRYMLHHDSFDWAFIIVNSLVATTVFYFGLNPDTAKLNIPNQLALN